MFKKKMLVADQGYMTCPLGLVAENLPDNAGDVRDAASIPGSGRSPGGGHGNSPQCFCLRIPWTEEDGRLQSIRSQTVRHNRSDSAHTHLSIKRLRETHEAVTYYKGTSRWAYGQ